jgi:hypothetical protein
LCITSANLRDQSRDSITERPFPSIMRAPKANLDKSEVQPSPFDKLRAGSAGLDSVRVVLRQYLMPNSFSPLFWPD